MDAPASIRTGTLRIMIGPPATGPNIVRLDRGVQGRKKKPVSDTGFAELHWKTEENHDKVAARLAGYDFVHCLLCRMGAHRRVRTPISRHFSPDGFRNGIPGGRACRAWIAGSPSHGHTDGPLWRPRRLFDPDGGGRAACLDCAGSI